MNLSFSSLYGIFSERAPLVSFCFFFVLGVLLQHMLLLSGLILIVLVILFLLFGWWIKKTDSLIPLLWCVTIFCGMLRYANMQQEVDRIEEELDPLDGKSVQLIGNIKSVQKVTKGFRYNVVNTSISSDNMVYEKDILVQVYDNVDTSYQVGEKIKVKGVVRLHRGRRNPGAYDFRFFYRRQNIWFHLYQDWNSRIVLLESDEGFEFDIWVEQLRRSIYTLFSDKIGGDASKLISAITIGLREEIPYEIRQDFVDTGVVHVLAVSGLHVGFVLVFLFALVKLFRFPHRWDRIAIIVVLIAFAVLSGGRASVWRATIMASIYVIAPIFHREANIWNVIATSALVLLIYNPFYLFDAGFLLSFSAVTSIVFFLNLLETGLPKRFRVSSIQNRILKRTVTLFLISFFAQIGTLPFIWLFFNRLPIVSLVANVFIVPLIGILVSIGFAILLLGSWIPFVGEVFGASAWFISEVVFWIIHIFSVLPFAYLNIGSPSRLNIVQYITLLLSFILLIRKEFWKKGVLSLLLAANLFIWPSALHRDLLNVIFLDVDQGDSILIQTPTNSGQKNILIDAGMKSLLTDKGKTVVVPVLKYLGINRIDLLIMSHPHDDHIGGVETVLSTLPVSQVWETYSNYDSELYQNVKNSISKLSIPYRRVGSGKQILDFSPLQIYVLHPDSLYTISEEKVNNMSLVLKFVYGDVSFLFTGDLEKDGVREMLTFGKLNHATVLKVGHHGSRSSSTQSLIGMVKPQYAVILVGERNIFKHPSEEVVTFMENSGIDVFRTDRDGACWFKSDGERVWLYNWR